MLTTEEKLQHFSQVVFKQAKKQCDEILIKAEKEAESKVENHEMNCLNAAYKHIQKQMSIIEKSFNESISKFQLQTKKEILERRETIVQEVFQQVLQKIQTFTQSEEYLNFLQNSIEDAISRLGNGELVIYLDINDQRYLDLIKEKYQGIPVELLPAEDKLIGGTRVFCKTTLQIAEFSIAKRLQTEKEKFLNDSGLIIT